MGAGIAAVAGIENEPSSQRADIEEAQAELRQELTGRNERRRELEFLEKGGDPLEFKFGEPLPDRWSLPPTDPLVKHIISSDERGDIDDKREDFSQEDGSDSKRARGISGKFCYQDLSATSISIERTLPDALPATVSSSVEHDRKEPPKKELDASKSNKLAVTGQYARRNRQRSNRFSNGLAAASRELGKVETEGGFISSSTIEGNVSCAVEAKDVAKDTPAQHVIANEVTLQTRSTDAEVSVAKGQQRVSGALDLPEAATTLQALATHEPAIESVSSETLVLETTQGASPAEQDQGTKNLDHLSSIDSEDGRDIPTSLLPSTGEGQDLSLSVPRDAQAKKDMIEESSEDSFPLGTKEDIVGVTESNLNPDITTGHKVDQSEILVAGSDKTKLLADNSVFNDRASPAEHQSMVDGTRTLTTSKSTETVDALVESASPGLQLKSISSNSEKVIQAEDESLLEKEIDILLEKKININDSPGQAQQPGEIKVKIKDEAPSLSRISPLNVSNSQEVATLQLQHRADGSLNPACAGAESTPRLSDANGLPVDKTPVVSLPEEKTDLSLSDSIKDTIGPTAQKADQTLAAPEAEGCKDSLRDSVDRAKGRSFQDAPRKCSHWDFVLQEMAWLANDFMQERLWKNAAAAQIARWVVKEKQQLEFEEMEVCNRQRKLAQGLAKAVKKFWESVEKEATGSDSTLTDEALKVEAGMKTVKPVSSSAQVRPVQSYAIRFLKDLSERQLMPQAEAPPTPDRESEFGIYDFWEEQFSEESLFYTVPQNAMEVYRQSVVSHWEGEYEQRLQEHEATMAESEPHVAGEAMDYPSGTYTVGPLVSPLVGKRSSGFLGGNQTNRGSIPTKRMRTSAVAARQRAAGGTGPLVSIPVAHLARSDISSCETNSQQDEMTGLLEGSSVSGRATDVDSNGAFARNNLTADGVDSPFKSKKKKKTRHLLGGHAGSAGCDREPEHLWQHNSHRQSEQKEQSKQKGDQAALGLEAPGFAGAYHGTASVTSSANKLIKQIASRDRNRKYKGGKASLSQSGVGIPWSPVEDQAILGLVHELGLNWELVSDILSATSQLRGIFRKPKDCKERYRMLTERGGGDGGDSPDDPSSSAHHSISMTHKGTRYLPQHLEETLKSHVDCILQLHQQLNSRKLQSESQEPKQLVAEHESHGIKHTAMTPLELCELSSASGELVSHSYPIQPASHGNGLAIPSMLPSGVGMRPTSSPVSALQGVTNLQMSPSMSPSAAINAAATRDAQRMGVPMRPTTAEEQRLRYSRMVAGRGLPTQGLPVTSGSPLVNLPNTPDGTAPPSLPSGNSAGMMCSLSRGMPVTRTGLPGVGPIGVSNISTGMNNTPSVGMGLSGAGAVNSGAVSSPVNMMRRPREAISMGHSPSAALNNVNNSLANPVVSSPTQNFGAQQQLLQHNSLQSQQQSPGSSQQQAFNMMRVAKERQQLQQQQQKRMLQQQQSPTSNTLPSPFQSSQQPLPVSQQQHGLSPHVHLFSQHQPSHLMMQQHTLQEQQQHAAPPSSIPQSAVSPSGQPSLSGNCQTSQQQQSLSQTHQPTSTASPSQSSFQSKHQNPTIKQQQQQQQHQQGKNIKGIGRGEGQAPSQVSAQMSGQPMGHQRMGDSQGTLPQHLAGGSSAQNMSANLSQVSDGGAYSQKGFSQHLSGKHVSQQHLTSMSTSSSVQPASPPSGAGAPQQHPSPGSVGSLPSAQQQRRASQQSQGQQRRPQQSQVGMNLGTQLASQSAKTGLQASSVPPQLPAGFQLGANTNSPLNLASSSSGVPLSSPSNTSSGGFSSAQWKPGQTFTPMAAGLYNLSRSNSGIAAQAPHLAMSVGMHLPLPNGKIPVTGSSLATQEISRVGLQHVPGHVGTLSQKAPIGPVVNSRPVAPSQRQLVQQQQLGCTSNSTGGQQPRPASSGTAPAPE